MKSEGRAFKAGGAATATILWGSTPGMFKESRKAVWMERESEISIN